MNTYVSEEMKVFLCNFHDIEIMLWTFIFQLFNLQKQTTSNMSIKYSWLREGVQVGTPKAITIRTNTSYSPSGKYNL